MKAVDAVGVVGGLMTTTALLPQLHEVFRRQDTTGFSLGFAAWYILGLAVWVAYGAMLRSADVVAFNLASLVLMSVIVARVLWLRRRGA